MRYIGMLILLCVVGSVPAAIPAGQSYAETGRENYVAADTSEEGILKQDSLLLPLRLIRDSTMTLEPVPIVYLPDSLIQDTLKYEFVKIKNIAYKTRWTKELYKLIFVNPFPGHVNVMRTQNSEERFMEYAGKKIKDISIKVLPPYGTSVYDTTYYEEDLGWLRKLANHTHMKTAESVIRKQITLQPGMELLPFELVQNEILLRQLDYIEDATIIVTAVKGNPSEVNVIIVCKDKLSWGANIETNFVNSFAIGLENKNFLKLGHILNYEFSHKGSKDKKWGNKLSYDVNSLWGSHIDVLGYYQNDYREKIVKIEIERPFLTSTMKWAGGVAAGRVFYSDDLPDRNVSRLEVEDYFNYHYQDVWGGRSFLLKTKYGYNRNFYLTGRFFTTLFNNRPQVSSDTNSFYYDRLNYLAAFTYTKLKYYKANLIYDFGRTEDVPSGLFNSFLIGYENSEFQNYGYLGSFFRYSYFDPHKEKYYEIETALGSYVNKNGFERGFLKAGARYISNLYAAGSFRFRFYNDVNYIRGIRRYPEDYLYMQDYDIQGFQSDTLRGNQKLSGSASTTFFFPYVRKGFRFSTSVFVDAGAIAPLHESLLKCKTYWGLGVALNIRNDNVVIKNIHIRFTWYPTIPVDGRSLQAIISSGNRNGFYNYRVSKPQMIPYE